MSQRGSAASTIRAIKADLEALANAEDAVFLQRFFRTGPGEYGEGDRFLGIRVPALRRLVRKYESLSLPGCTALLRSQHHEARLLALLILVRAYARGEDATRAAIYRSYLDHTEHVNNWDLVDSSAGQIVGRHLADRDRSPLLRLAKSDSVWERRIAIIATFSFIKAGDFRDTFRISNVLLSDSHDLVHKAVGWMLREVGNRDRAKEEAFLRSRYKRMPRTMLRYAIEKFPKPLRMQYLRGEI